MKALSIRQPWASLILTGSKRIENRTWSTQYRGPLFIHTGLQIDQDAIPFAPRRGSQQLQALLQLRGVLMGKVMLVDVHEFTEADIDPFAEGPYCFVLESPVIFYEPVPTRGHLGLFTVPDSLVEHIDKRQKLHSQSRTHK